MIDMDDGILTVEDLKSAIKDLKARDWKLDRPVAVVNSEEEAKFVKEMFGCQVEIIMRTSTDLM